MSICQIDPVNKSKEQRVLNSEGFKIYKRANVPADEFTVKIDTK